MEPSYQIQTLQGLEEDAQHIQEPAAENWTPTELDDIESDLTPRTLYSILHHMEQMQRIDDMGQSTETT
jgi:hypothetical protein